MGIKIERVTLRQIRMPLVHFFETSFGRTYERHMVLVEVVADGVSGWLVPPGKPEAWARAMARAIDLGPGKRGEMGDFLDAIQRNPSLWTAIVAPSGEGISLSYKR